MKYKLGADGSNKEIDCIHLCYKALADIGIPTPTFKTSWYERNTREILRDLAAWGDRVSEPYYDGDVLVLLEPDQGWAFGVAWQKGFLLINGLTKQVNWCPSNTAQLLRAYRYSPTKNS